MTTSEIRFASVAPRPTIVVSATVHWPEFPSLWRPMLDQVYAFIRSSDELLYGVDGAPRWQNVMLYKDGSPNVEVGVLAPGPFTPAGSVVASQLPAGRTATATHVGDPSHIGESHDAVRRFAQEQGVELAGPCWEIYGHPDGDSGEFETEIYHLLR